MDTGQAVDTSLLGVPNGVVGTLPQGSDQSGSCSVKCTETLLDGGGSDFVRIRRPKKKRPRKPKKVLSEWMVVRTKPHQERYAAKNVRRQGYKAFVPFVRDERDRETPLFTSHIFVLGPAWYYLRNTYGVSSTIMMGDVPGRMPIKEMQALLASAGEDDVIETPRPDLTPGMKIKLTRGSFKDIWATLVELRGKDRVLVLLKILGGDVTMELTRREVATS